MLPRLVSVLVAKHPAPVLLHAGNTGSLTGPGNNTWLLDGAQPALIDAGIGAARHVSAIARALRARSLVRVLVTHGHPDHASGVPALRMTWPSIEACKYPLRGESGWRALKDGEAIRAGDRMLTVMHTPGHAQDHVCFWDAELRDLYTGDMLILGTSVMIPFGRGGNLREYLQSLERLAALEPVRIFPGHGQVIDAPLEVIEQYLKHRQLREHQILECLSAKVTDVTGIVARLYPGLESGLLAAARSTVEAHLAKLREEGRLS
jgi:glyoxylase-like metal-dependent hydrolase (beta-lactamase superfamily II)